MGRGGLACEGARNAMSLSILEERRLSPRKTLVQSYGNTEIEH